ncbi:C-5 sterol desaturase erg31 [Zancudomyces culisetae]|uniref:C-5 sterol desaturase erg31 n=1 Tax=Zancudomyces culisetae TaxID=1213189 RepID=A0A1R1PWI2_ZANCU|nr:C-5 sterol desaturase erg31 [Zancudomyces culisetae]|eukprot:OMH85355.1 C-5 sterol desaturase erg31 [Zancudomyces culisetae]
MEIQTAMKAFPVITILTMPWIYGEIHGKSLLYDDLHQYGLTYLVLSGVGFIIFTDFCIYWVHRIEHHPLFYATFHKLHHKWIGK